MHITSAMQEKRLPLKEEQDFKPDLVIEAFKKNDTDFLLNFFKDSDVNLKYNSREIEGYEVILQDQPTIACLASYFGNMDILKFLLLQGADFNLPDSTLRTCMHFAATSNHIDVLNFLLDYIGNPLATDKGGRTFIHYAAEANNVSVLRWAKAHNYDLDVPCPTGAPIHYACQFHCLQAVDYLASQNVNLNRSLSNRTPLILALNSFFFEAIPILQNYGLDINRPGLGNWPVLFYAIRSHDIVLVKNLIDLGASVNQEYEGWTPLHVAAQEGFLDAVKLLVEKGADLFALTKHNLSPFLLSNTLLVNEKEKGETANYLREQIIEKITSKVERKLIKKAIEK